MRVNLPTPKTNHFHCFTNEQQIGGKKLAVWLLMLILPTISLAKTSVEKALNVRLLHQQLVQHTALEEEINTEDKASILQKCIDLPQLQQAYPKNTDGSFKKLYVMQHGVSFPATLGVTHSGQSLLYVTKEEIKKASTEAYFYFHTFAVDQNTARIEYTFYHDQLSSMPKMQVVTLELQKTAGSWNITDSKVETR